MVRPVTARRSELLSRMFDEVVKSSVSATVLFTASVSVGPRSCGGRLTEAVLLILLADRGCHQRSAGELPSLEGRDEGQGSVPPAPAAVDVDPSQVHESADLIVEFESVGDDLGGVHIEWWLGGLS